MENTNENLGSAINAPFDQQHNAAQQRKRTLEGGVVLVLMMTNLFCTNQAEHRDVKHDE